MGKRIILKLHMKLLSDAIFGSGYSVPGAEDISVCMDKEGYPYLKGSTFKGLLRDSLQDLLCWMGKEDNALYDILGEEGWTGTADDRRATFSPMTLLDPPMDPEDCFSTRTFTSLENGIVKEGTLRTAKCIRGGLYFEGTLCCDEADEALISSAVKGIKWVGTMRSRGFGRVGLTAERVDDKGSSFSVGQAHCIRYILHTDSPVLSTDQSRSDSNNIETYGYITGSAVRGMVMGYLSRQESAFFAENKEKLLSDSVRFLDAVPNPGEQYALPSPKGFYEDKRADGSLQSVLKDGMFTSGYKRAKLGQFCSFEGDTIRYWSAETDGVTRIDRDPENKQVFHTRYLNAGQDFEGYILLDDEELAPVIAKAFSAELRLGADRYAGFGKCSIKELASEDAPIWTKALPYSPSDVIYLLAVSPLAMLNECGELCGLDETALADILGVGTVKVELCSTSVADFGSYNRTWKCREATVRMYDRGSVFKLVCDRAPSAEAVKALQRNGLGIRRASGFGQVLCLTKDKFEKLTHKAALEKGSQKGTVSNAAGLRQKKCRWVMDHADICESGLSRSQLGSIQALCEEAIANGGSTSDLEAFMTNNLTGRGAEHGSKFRMIADLISSVLEKPLSETLGCSAEKDDAVTRLELLVMLFNFCRKEKEG